MTELSGEERYKDMINGLTDSNRDHANALINQGLDIKKRAHKIVDIFACCQTLFNPEIDDKMDKATKLLKYCQQITPKFTMLLKAAAGLVQTAADSTGNPNKKQKLNTVSESAAIGLVQTGPPNKKQKLDPVSESAGAAASSTGGQTGNLTPAPAPSPTDGTPPKTEKTSKPKGGKKKGGGKGAAKKTTLKND